MKTLGPVILSTICIFMLNLGLNFITDYLSEDKGVITIGPTVLVEREIFTLASFSNLSKEPTDGVTLSIPAKTQIASIKASAPVKLEPVSDSASGTIRKHITVSAIEPNRVTVLMIPLECTAHDFLDTVVAVLDLTSRAHWSAIGAPTPIVCVESL